MKSFGLQTTRVLNTLQIEAISKKFFLIVEKNPTMKEFLQEVIDYNKNSAQEMNFYDYTFQNRNVTNISSLKNTYGVRKKRLNDKLSTMNLTINRDFKFELFGDHSLEEIMLQAISVLKGKMIKKLKLFDFYNGQDKCNLFTNETNELLKKILKFNGEIEVISSFDSIQTQNFYKELLVYMSRLQRNKKNLKSNITIKYTRKPFYHTNSLIYALIEDGDKNNYIIYFEEMIKWGVCQKISDSLQFSKEFYNILSKRFDFFYKKKANSIIPHEIFEVTQDMLSVNKDDSQLQVFEIMNELNLILQNKYSLKDNINKKIEKQILKIKKLKLQYPKMHNSNQLLFHITKLIDVIVICKTNNNAYPKTKEIFEIINTFNLFNLLSSASKDISKEKLFLFPENVNLCNNYKEIIHIKTLPYNENTKASLSEIFSNLNWNTKELIVKSINEIIIQKHYQMILLLQYIPNSYSLKHSKKRKYINSLTITQKMILSNYIFSKIFNIPFKEELTLILKSENALTTKNNINILLNQSTFHDITRWMNDK